MITIALYNGLCNRLLPLISCIRIAKKYNSKICILWSFTPSRTCINYYGEFCNLNEIFKIPSIIVDEKPLINYNKIYEFKFWEDKDHVIDIAENDTIYINYALSTIISKDDDDTFLKNLKNVISKPREIISDNISKELGNILKTELTPVKELEDEIEKIKKQFYKNMIGIHIRKSDGGFTNYDWKNIIIKLIEELKIWCEDVNNGVFLATDDKEVYNEFFNCLGNKLIFYNPPKILNNTESTTEDKFSNDKYNIMCAVIELYLLGSCNKYIIGTVDSTFSVCAMLMSEENVKKYLINDVDSIPKIN